MLPFGGASVNEAQKGMKGFAHEQWTCYSIAMTHTSLHTHTVFCDGQDDIETMCRAAWEKGLAAIGFSAHAPVRRKTGLITNWHLREELVEDYAAGVRAAGRRWEGKLPVYLGMEVDYIKGLIGPADRDIQELGLDFIIASVHYLLPPGGGGPFAVDGSMEELEQGVREGFAGDGEAMMEHYWDAVQDMIAAGGFDILGHVDLVKKNNTGERWFKPGGGRYSLKARQTAQAAGKTTLVVEVNTGGLIRGKTAETYPSIPVLRLFRENQVPALITADAHRAQDLDGHYQKARQSLLAAGYLEHNVIMGKKNGRLQWAPDSLEP
jgi:histidinol-phosphatase (PHP family)